MQDRCTLRNENGDSVIEIMVTDLNEFYNPFDPSPIKIKDLRQETVEYILESLTGKEKNVRFRLFLADELYADEKVRTGIEQAIPAYFKSRHHAAVHNHKIENRKGRRHLVRGLLFLITCVVLSTLITSFSGDSVLYAAGQSLVVIGWVALWKPAEFYLYENRDLKNTINQMNMLSESCIETRLMK